MALEGPGLYCNRVLIAPGCSHSGEHETNSLNVCLSAFRVDVRARPYLRSWSGRPRSVTTKVLMMTIEERMIEKKKKKMMMMMVTCAGLGGRGRSDEQ